MSTMTHPGPSVKPDNVLEPTAAERDEAAAAITIGRSTPIDQRTLPAIDGSGLTEQEFFRVNGYGNRARVAYAESMPDADAIEIARVERIARQDGLRAVLRDRPAALPLPEPAVVACCSPSEAEPCAACVDVHGEEAERLHRELAPDWFEALEADEDRRRLRREQKRAAPSFRITDDCGDCYFEAAPGLTLEKVIADDVARLIKNPGMFDAERVIWQGPLVMAVIGMRGDGSPFVTMLDETPDEEESDESDPATWPAWTDEDRWEIVPDDDQAAAEQATLTLAELIDHEAAPMSRMETGAGDLMWRALAELARTVRVVGAMVPADVDARLEVLDRDFIEHAAAWEMPEPELTPAGRVP